MPRSSAREKRLTEVEEIALRAWYYAPRTVREMAAKLGISERALYDYVHWRHKPRKDCLASESMKFHGEQGAR